MRKLQAPMRHASSIHLAEKCKDESVLLAAGRWMCRFCDPRVKFHHREKTKLAYCMSACVRVSVCIFVGWKEPLQYVEEISSAPKLGFQWNRVCGIKATGADSLSRGKHTSQTALSQLPAGLSRESACPPAFRLSCGVYTTDQWLPIPQVSLLLCILSPSLRFVLENFHNLLQVVHTIQYQGIHRKKYSWFATYSRKNNN